MTRITRYQGAIIRDQHILLIKHTEHASGRCYWLIPGGGREPDETETACVQREMHEETGLQVQVRALLLDEPGLPGGVYQRHKTYLCEIVGGEARPGYEPEPEAAAAYSITEVGWIDLRPGAVWPAPIADDPITGPLLRRLQAVLGQRAAGQP